MKSSQENFKFPTRTQFVGFFPDVQTFDKAYLNANWDAILTDLNKK